MPKLFRRVTTPTVLQMESTECGAAALGIVLGFYGRHVPLEILRVECRVSRDGSNALYVKKTAETYGLVGRGYQLGVEELRELEPPFVVFWRFNHFLVVEGFGRGRVYLNDPATGRRTEDLETFAGSYTGIVFRFEPGPNFRKGGAGSGAGTWGALARRLRGARGAAVHAVLAGVAVMACELVAATYNLIFVDQILVEERRQWLRPLLLAMGVTAGFRVVVGVLQLGALRRLRLSLSVAHSARFLRHVLRLPAAFYQQRFAGEVAGRVEGNSLVADLISGQLATTAVGLSMVGFYAAVMLAFDPALTAVGVAIGCLNLAGITAVGRSLADENLKIKQVRGKLHGSMTRLVQIIETVKAGASEPEALTRLTGQQARLTNASQVVGAANAFLIALPPFLLLLTTAAVLWLGGGRVIDGLMSVGALLAFQTLLIHFNRPFGDLVRLGSSVQLLRAELARLDDVYEHRCDPVYEPVRRSEDDPERREPPRRLAGHLVIKDVTFGYSRTVDEPLIRKFSMEIAPGSRVALVGASGSGKSTIGKMAAGLFSPWEGEILYDGFRLGEIPREVFTSQVALVDDQTFLFRGSVRDNLTLWDETIPDREMVRAAIDAGLHRDLIRRRGAYHAHLNEGASNLSGGERQRLEIARALIREPSLLILDEATSALDPVTEAMVDDNIRRRGCTCLIIAHRLSTIRDCDEILVLDHGRVVQRGAHDALMADRAGPYHELQRLQEGFESRAETRARVISAPSASKRPGTAKTNGRHLPKEEPPDFLETLKGLGVEAETAGNLPIALDDAGATWRVLSGQVDVFYTQPEPGRGWGSRRHLCRVEEGGSIFALGGVRGAREGSLLAVGVGVARLLKVRQADLLRLALEAEWRRDVAALVDDWIDRISRAVDPSEAPRASARLEAGVALVLGSGRPATARGRVLWLRTACEGRGGLKFLGEARVPPCPLGSRFPLSPHAWLTFEGDETLRPVDTETLMEDGDPWVGLKRFHRVILDAIAQSRSKERAIRHARLESSGLRDEATVAEALEDLARLAAPRARGRVSSSAFRDAEWLAACREVGGALGISIKEPAIDAEGEPLRLIAHASGFRTRRVRLVEGWWTSDGGPLLGNVGEGGRPVALLTSRGAGYVLVDPARAGPLAVDAAIAGTLASSALMFYPTLPRHPLKAGDLVRFCMPAVRGEARIIVMLGVLAGLLGLAAPLIAAVVIDDVIPRADRGLLGLLCAFLGGIGLAAAGFQVLQGLALVRLKGKLEARLLPAAWERLLSLPTRFFSHYESGDLAYRALGLARLIDVAAGTSIASLLVGSSALLNLFALFVLDWRLALVASALVAALPIATLATIPPLWRLQRAFARAQGRISGLVFSLLGGVSRIRVAGAERRAFARWAGEYRRQLDLSLRFQTVSDRLLILGEVWPIVVLMVVFAAAVGAGSETIRTGDFLAFSMALAQGMAAVIALGRSLPPILNGLDQFERLRPILEATPEGVGAGGEAVVLEGAIRLTNVSFRYEEDGRLVLDGVNLQVRPGEFVAVVGPSGSGKSTLLRLLLGFETPSEGEITYDGRDLATLDVREVRRQVGVVLQDAQLFPGDIYTNIVGLASGLSTADALEAATLAGFADDLEQLPMGLHTVIGDGGGGLSGGQRQRLIIARALASRPKILLLDEATSALDNRAQAVVGRGLHARLQGTSRLAIAHRLSTVVDADRIYVLSAGKIVQSGRYSQLINEPGPFRDLAMRQTPG